LEISEAKEMKKLSARNQLRGRIIEVRKGQITAHVRIDIGNGVVITSSITNEAVDDLKLVAGDDVVAVIKASDVSFFMNKFRKLGFIDYNGGLEVHSSLLNMVLHETPGITKGSDGS
jgi:molybdopterin-binding protein